MVNVPPKLCGFGSYQSGLAGVQKEGHHRVHFDLVGVARAAETLESDL
jgi:hypothetical protein